MLPNLICKVSKEPTMLSTLLSLTVVPLCEMNWSQHYAPNSSCLRWDLRDLPSYLSGLSYRYFRLWPTCVSR